MDFRKLLDKLQDKTTTPSSVKPSPLITRHERQSLEEKKITKLSKWRGKWVNVSKPRLFSNKKRDHRTNDTSCPSSLHEPTITLSSSTIHQRPYSAIGHVSNFVYSQHQQQRPISCTPTSVAPRSRQPRLSVPYVVDHLRSTTHATHTPLDAYSSDDAGSFYNAPLSPPPPPARRSTWYHVTRYNNDELMDDTTTDSITSFSSSTDWVSKDNDDPCTNESQSPMFVGNQATTSISNETLLQQQQDDSTSHDDNDHPPAAMPCQEILEKRPHYQLATMNVANTMMAMREKQLELRMETLTIKNQQLGQQMEDMVSGTWTSTTQLIEENDRLESQIRQLQNQQQQQQQRRMKPPPPPLNGNGGGGGSESYWQDEQEALRHTRAQLGLVEYLEGEPDVMAALNRFKKLLASSC